MLENYFKIALRNLKQNKVYMLINTLGLGLGSACAILIFLLVRYHLSFDEFHANPDRIYRVVTEQHRDNISYSNYVPNPLGKVLREDYTFSEQVARVATFDQELISVNSGKEVKKFKEKNGVAFTETAFFDIFNYPLLQGDIKTALTEPNTAILTERLANKYFGSSNPVGKILRVDNRVDLRVTAVLENLPVNTDRKTEIYASYATLKAYEEWFSRDDFWGGMSSEMQCYVRLKPRISPRQVEKVLSTYVMKYRANSKNVHHYKLQSLSNIHFDSRYGGLMEKKNLWALAFIGLALIITSGINFINLATALAVKRAKEVGIRKVLGGNRAQLFWQFVTETGLLMIVAMTLAIGLTFVALPYVNGWFSSQLSFNLIADRSLVIFIMTLTLVLTFFAGSYPGLILAEFKPVEVFQNKVARWNVAGFNIRRVLIIFQFAICQVLVISMIVISSQMRYSKQSDLGFDKDAVIMLPFGSGSTATTSHTLKNRLNEIAGVKQVSLCFTAPTSHDDWNTDIGYDNRPENEPFKVSVKAGDEHYVPAFGLELVTGRNVFPSDSVREFLVNETFVRKLNLSSPEQVIGKTISLDGGEIKAPIVGVIKDFHDKSFHQDISAVCIMPSYDLYNRFAVKVSPTNLKTTLALVDRIWSETYPNEVYEHEFLDAQIGKFYETEEAMLKWTEVFAGIAIFIGCMGLYGLVSFMALQKTKEIGIRKVLGSSLLQILWIFGKEFSVLILIAFLIATPLAGWLMNSWLQHFTYHVELNSWIFVLTIGVTLIIAGLTVAYKAVVAALANPVKSLRSE
jgi:ABC-type antimicrobial peptide transport system permease subunit